MATQQLGWITNFIWGIADDVLRDVYVRGKYRDVILPMVVIRRLDAVLEPTKQAVLAMKKHLDAAGIANQDAALRHESGQAFFNASPFTLRDLKSIAKIQQLKADFEAYLDGFSSNVQEILDKFKFRYGSTLSNDGFPAKEFDFMLSNPPYGKSWKTDLERMGGKGEMKDPRFVVQHAGIPDLSLITRSSDGQLMFLANKLAKMKGNTPLGSRIAEVHNGSSLFTGDAGQGESNIRRWILENDWLEAIVALPLNMFYNTGIATYVWVLSNRKPAHREGKVQLIDATSWFKPLRKNLGSKNCELSPEDIRRVSDTFLAFEEGEQSKIFPNEAFGYWKVTTERPLRLIGIDPSRVYTPKEIKELRIAHLVDQAGPPVIRKAYRGGKAGAGPLHGIFEATVEGKPCLVEYEPDSELRDTESVPLLEEGGVEAFVRREVLPYVPDAWIQREKTEVGYEISFTRYFYKPKPLRALEEIRADILALQKETEGLLEELLQGTAT